MKKDISFKNDKGQTLMGVLYVPEEKFRRKFPSVIVCHGFFGNKDEKNKVSLADALLEAGFIVFRFDFSGHGNSEGKFEEITLSQQVSELRSAIDALFSLKEADKKRIGVVGHSLGGSTAIVGAARDSRIKSLVTIGAAYDKTKAIKILTDTQGFKKWKRQGFTDIWVNEHKEKINYSFWEDLMKYKMLNFVKKIKIPYLVIHAEKDELIGVYQAKEIAKVANADLKIAQGETHAFGGETVNFTVDWFKKTFKR